MCWNYDPLLLLFPTRFGGLGIPLFHENAGTVFENSRKLTSSLTDFIKDQQNWTKENQTSNQIPKRRYTQKCFEHTAKSFKWESTNFEFINREKGVSIWLTSYLISDHGFSLTKQ